MPRAFEKPSDPIHDPWLTPSELMAAFEINQRKLDYLLERGMPSMDLCMGRGGKRILRFRQSSVTAWYRSYRAENAGTIYVVGFGPYVKIGFSRGDGERRIRVIEFGAPEPLIIYAKFAGTFEDEARLHQAFSQQCSRGEWFRLEGAIKVWVEGGCLPEASFPSPTVTAEGN